MKYKPTDGHSMATSEAAPFSWHEAPKETQQAIKKIIFKAIREDKSVQTISPYVSPGLQRNDISLTLISTTVCTYFDVDSAFVFAHCRVADAVNARQFIIYILRTWQKMTFSAIGSYLHRDHSSIMASFNRALCLLETEQAMRDNLDKIMALIKKGQIN